MTITLDKEWVALIKKALELGISVEEIRDFFEKQPSIGVTSIWGLTAIFAMEELGFRNTSIKH